MSGAILAADIGGTNSRFAHFILDAAGRTKIVAKTWLDTKAARSFAELIEMLRRSEFPLKPEQADVVALAVAGPVQRRVFCAPPLIEWTIDLSRAQEQFGFRRVSMINDFVAQAFACRSPVADSAEEILSGESDTTGAVGVVGAGTGLGKSYLIPDPQGQYAAGPSEGGHVPFAAESEREFRFAQFVVQQRGGNYASSNDIISGRGLSLIHAFLTGENLEPAEIAGKFETNPETAEWMARFYGRVCRNFALEVLATGGMYIAGGVAAKNPLLVRHPEFKRAFRDSRAHHALLAKIPVYLLINEESGLWGAGFHGAQLL